jgi:hypothetical protein
MRASVKWGMMALAVLLPGICLVLSLIGEIRILFTPEPRWTISEQEAGIDNALADCADAGRLEVYHAQPVEDTDMTIISAAKAKEIADQVIERHHPSLQGFYAEGPHLTHMMLPDGQERLAWYRVLVTDDGGATLIGKADIVYVDAQTGDPLIRITDAPISDPAFACGMDSVFPRDRLIRWAGILVSALYFVFLALVGGLWQWRRRAARQIG